MIHRWLVAPLAVAMLLSAACHHKTVTNPIANIDSKQPDKVLFDRAMDAMKQGKYADSRLLLDTLLNTYPESEYVARAQLSLADSWYQEGGTGAWTNAEEEYKKFITFFPNMPEAAEASLKIANMHFELMDKPDRDFTQAKEAEQAYRDLLKTYPDSPLTKEARVKLREVQEVLAEREFRIGRFYYMKDLPVSYTAAIARLKSLVDTYPLYSGASEALFMIGDSYQREATFWGQQKLNETVKGNLIKDLDDNAAQAYARIITRYPVSDRADEARKRLQAMHRPVPTPTAEAIAQNKAEEKSRGMLNRRQRALLTLHRRPDVSHVSQVGEPTLDDPTPTSATDLTKRTDNILSPKTDGGGEGKAVTVEEVGSGQPAPNQPAPRSKNDDANGIPELPIASQTGGAAPATSSQSGSADASTTDTPAAPPAEENNATPANASTPAAAGAQPGTGTDSTADSNSSSSKSKKKTGLRKLIPF